MPQHKHIITITHNDDVYFTNTSHILLYIPTTTIIYQILPCGGTT
jgi:hypothetical protein